MVEFFTKKLKGIVGINDIELNLDADGEDDVEEKLKSTEKTLDEFEETIDRLFTMVDSMKIPDDGGEEDVSEGTDQECAVDEPIVKDYGSDGNTNAPTANVPDDFVEDDDEKSEKEDRSKEDDDEPSDVEEC